MHTLYQPRRAWFALLMSMVLPGFGQLYNGQANKAIYVFLSFALVLIPGLALVALYLPTGWVVPVGALATLATLLLWCYGMADAWRTARSQSAYTPRPWQVGGMYALVFVLCNGVALPLCMGYVQSHVVASYHIPSTSMEPSVRMGDVLFADKRYNCPGCQSTVQRGDVAIFTYPNNRTQNYIKRVVALPGDRVQIQGRQVRVNGVLLNQQETATAQGWLVTEQWQGRSWQVQWASDTAPLPELDMQVPPGHAFVLGDNRSTSHDTRQFGTVPLQDIVGKALQIWFSRSHEEGVRWERLGAVVR